MTLRDSVSMPEGISSSTAQVTTVDPQKAKISRRRRLEIQRLKSTCNNNVTQTDDTCRAMMVENNKDGDTCCAHGVVSVMGRRREMEDAVKVEKCFFEFNNNNKNNNNTGVSSNNNNNRYDYFGVYDGHGGCHVADACKDRMHVILSEEIERMDTCKKMEGCDWERVMGKCFEKMHEEVGRGKDDVEEMTVGSTAVVAVVGNDEVVVANCGDSRAVISRNGVAVPLSVDHKPDRPDELARIEAADGRVINWNGHRVLGVLATSRSIGDYYLKPYVSPTPEIIVSKRTEVDEFLILASDGLWDVISNEVACQVVRRCLHGRIKSPEVINQFSKISSNRAEVAAVLLAELAIAKGSKDNISVIVVKL